MMDWLWWVGWAWAFKNRQCTCDICLRQSNFPQELRVLIDVGLEEGSIQLKVTGPLGDRFAYSYIITPFPIVTRKSLLSPQNSR